MRSCIDDELAYVKAQANSGAFDIISIHCDEKDLTDEVCIIILDHELRFNISEAGYCVEGRRYPLLENMFMNEVPGYGDHFFKAVMAKL